ncbi:MAG: hypothetical protein KC983_07605, partial [Phycisphaerales bacterium]|nr:hypothetical protein [Phycisphaerales bacterium]
MPESLNIRVGILDTIVDTTDPQFDLALTAPLSVSLGGGTLRTADLLAGPAGVATVSEVPASTVVRAVLPVTPAQPGLFDAAAPMPNGTISLGTSGTANAFDDPSTSDRDESTNITLSDSLRAFTRLSPAATLSPLLRLSTWLDALRNDPAYDAEIPLVDEVTVADLIDFSNTLRTGLLDQIEGTSVSMVFDPVSGESIPVSVPNGNALFPTLQDMLERANGGSAGPLSIGYDLATNALTFRVTLSETATSVFVGNVLDPNDPNAPANVEAVTFVNANSDNPGENFTLQLVIPVHGLKLGDRITITGVNGVPEANGTFTVRTIVDENRIHVGVFETDPGAPANAGGGTVVRLFSEPLELNLDLDPLTALAAAAASDEAIVTLTPTTMLDFAYRISLDPKADPTPDANDPTQAQDQRNLIADSGTVLPQSWRLSSTASFELILADGTSTTVTLLASATQDNTTVGDLLLDLNGVLPANHTASVTPDGRLQITSTAGNIAITVVDPANSAATELGLRSSTVTLTGGSAAPVLTLNANLNPVVTVANSLTLNVTLSPLAPGAISTPITIAKIAEKQTLRFVNLSFDGTDNLSNNATFTLTWNNLTTGALDITASALDVQTAIRGLHPSLAGVVVTRAAEGPPAVQPFVVFEVEFAGVAGDPAPLFAAITANPGITYAPSATVRLTQKATLINVLQFVDALQDAFDAAFGADQVTVGLKQLGTDVGLKFTSRFNLAIAADADAALLGFAGGASTVPTRSAVSYAGSEPLRTVPGGTLNNVNFALQIDDAAPVAVTLGTVTFAGTADLVAQIQSAVNTAIGANVVTVGASGNRLYFELADVPSDTFIRIYADSSSAMTTVLGFRNGQFARASELDAAVFLRNATPGTPAFSAAIDLSYTAQPALVGRYGFVDVDFGTTGIATGSGMIEVNWAGTDPNGTFALGELRSVGGALVAATPYDLTLLGQTTETITFDLTLNARPAVQISLSARQTDDNSSLEDLISDLNQAISTTDLAGLVVAEVDQFVTSTTDLAGSKRIVFRTNAGDSLSIALPGTPNFDTIALGFTDGQSAASIVAAPVVSSTGLQFNLDGTVVGLTDQLDITVGLTSLFDRSAPNVNFIVTGAGSKTLYDNLNLNQVLNGLTQVRNLLSDAQLQAEFQVDLPFVGRTIAQINNYQAVFNAMLQAVSALQPESLQVLEQAVRENLGLDPLDSAFGANDPGFRFVPNGNALGLELRFENADGSSIGINIDAYGLAELAFGVGNVPAQLDNESASIVAADPLAKLDLETLATVNVGLAIDFTNVEQSVPYEVQTITLLGIPASGGFKLSWNGFETDTFTLDDTVFRTAAGDTIQDALRKLGTPNPNNPNNLPDSELLPLRRVQVGRSTLYDNDANPIGYTFSVVFVPNAAYIDGNPDVILDVVDPSALGVVDNTLNTAADGTGALVPFSAAVFDELPVQEFSPV